MEIKKAIQILKQHNSWRRSDEDYPEMVNPTELGLAIDTIIKHFEE
jgi:hypothetical protein